MKLIFLLTSVVFLTTVVTNWAQTTCSEGTYLLQFDENSFCDVCPPGTFMPWKNHTASTCFECTKIEDSTVEILISPCDRFHDADIQCKDGYFRRLARNPRDKPTCLKCTPGCPQHHFQVHRCENFTDLGCCPGENYDYEFYHGNSGPRKCRERPWMCGRGQYLDTTVNDCKPCPGNTFMPEDYHSYTTCWDCHYKSEAERPLHTVITQNCTSNQPARYRCKDGYYMNHGMSYRGDDVGCSPCNSCDEGMYEVRHCDGYHDTVCCHKPNNPVVDVPLGGQCVDKIEELMTYPSVGSLQVRKGGCQSVICYTALTKKKTKPVLTWYGPKVDKDQQFPFEDENYQSGVTVYHNTLTLCNFSTVHEGQYHCRDNRRTLNQEIQIYIGLACRYGTYNPPECDKLCSQHCLVSEESDGSPCHHNNGTCLFGCQEGYTGSWCEASLDEEGGNGTEPVADSTIVLSIILVLVILVCTLCVVYNRRCPGRGPKWWRRLANQIFSIRRARYKPDEPTEDVEQQHLIEVAVTPTVGQSLTLDQVKQDVSAIVQTLGQMAELHSDMGIQYQQNLHNIFWEYFELRVEIGDYLAQLGLPEICVKFAKDYLFTRKNIQNDQIWSVTDYTYRVCRCYSAVSFKFAKGLADFDAVQVLTKILMIYLDNLGGERERLVVKSSIVGLRHLAVHLGNIHQFQDCNTVKVLKPLTNSGDESIKSLARIAIDTIGGEKEKVQLSETPGPSRELRETDTVPKEEKLEKICQLFVSNCVPNDIIHLFHFYNGGVLAQDDIEIVASATSKYGQFHGASELWNRLLRYKDWYRCLLLVLRDPKVKQAHVAKSMENVLEPETADVLNQKLTVYSTKLSKEIGDVKQENENLKVQINTANQEISESTDEINRAKQEIGKLADEVKKKYRDNSQLTQQTDENYPENAKRVEIKENDQETRSTDLTLIQRIRELQDEIKQLIKEIAAPDLDLSELRIIRKDDPNISDEKTMRKIRELFEDYVDPKNIISLFHVYNTNVLTQSDIEEVSHASDSETRHRAVLLLDRLIKYKGWYTCLLQVFRNPKVKLDHVADKLEDVLGRRSGSLERASGHVVAYKD